MEPTPNPHESTSENPPESEKAAAPFRVSGIVYPGFELLDLFGPLEFFSLLEPRVCLEIFAETGPSVASSAGPRVLVDRLFEEAGATDILLLPGGIGTRNLVHNANFLRALRRLCDQAKTVACVCTGSALLAKTGLLDGRQATSNKQAFDWVRAQNTRVHWQAEARWVRDGKFYTSSGISAGMDLALDLIQDLFGPSTRAAVAAKAEYLWNSNPGQDPFAAKLPESSN